MALSCKAGVRLSPITPALLDLLSVLLDVWPEAVITSGSDGRHRRDSKHYTGEAIDIRSHGLTREAKRTFRRRYQAALGEEYLVLLEDEGRPNEHFHAQVRRKGQGM
jgi:hypothetical protein